MIYRWTAFRMALVQHGLKLSLKSEDTQESIQFAVCLIILLMLSPTTYVVVFAVCGG